MQNKRDQVQAHMFLMGRLTSSMLRADPDSPESPQGRTNRGIAIGVLVGVIVSAGAFVFGLISPGTKDSWRGSVSLIVEKETGARYLYMDGRLRPVRNYSSARLLVGADLKTTTVGAKSLKGTPLGAAVGVPGAPDRLPSAGDLSDAAWQVCSSPAGGGTPVTTTLAVASGAAGGTPLGERSGLLAKGPDGTLYVLWDGTRLRLDTEHGAREALGYGSATPYEVSAALLSSLPAGPDLTPPDLDGRGTGGRALGGRAGRIGQLFKVAVAGSTTSRTYVLQADGLHQVSATVMALVLGDPRTRALSYAGADPSVEELGPDALRGALAPGSESGAGPGLLPESPPELVPVPKDRVPCVRIVPSTADSKGTDMSLSLVPSPALGPAAQPSGDTVAPACTHVDRVVVPPDTGVLVQALSASGQRGGSLYLVTSTGLKYRIASVEAEKALGYAATDSAGLPSQFLAMLPSGPDLSPDAATQGRAGVASPGCRY